MCFSIATVAMARVIDVTAAFPPQLIGNGLARLWTITNQRLVPVLDARGCCATCPITLEPFQSPVLLRDGFVYEEADILTWLSHNSSAPCTNTDLMHKRALRLSPLRDAVETFLSSSAGIRCLQSLVLQHAMNEARNPDGLWDKRISGLEACIATSEVEMDELASMLVDARSLVSELRAVEAEVYTSAALRLQTAMRARHARCRVTRIRWVRSSVQVWQAKMKCFLAQRSMLALWDQQQSADRRYVASVMLIQHWWRLYRKRMAKRAKRSRKRQQRKMLQLESAASEQSISICSTQVPYDWAIDGAFAAVRTDGSVLAWGDPQSGGDTAAVSEQLFGDVKRIYSTSRAFAALRADGSVVAWGDPECGGDTTGVKDQLRRDVRRVYATDGTFAALKNDGSVVFWPARYTRFNREELSGGVEQILCTSYAFAALKSNGSVVVWGCELSGGDAGDAQDELRSGVLRVYASGDMFTALKDDGSVIVWGGERDEHHDAPPLKVPLGIKQVCTNQSSFAAVMADGSVVAWGNRHCGGSIANVQEQLAGGVKLISSTDSAFAALKCNGSVVTWGCEHYGGCVASSIQPQLTSGVRQIYSAREAFAAVKCDGSVVTWGSWDYEDRVLPIDSIVQVGTGIRHICSTLGAFAALRKNGSVVVWGSEQYGGDSSAVEEQLSSGVVGVYSTVSAFVAVKRDGSGVAWGEACGGGSMVDLSFRQLDEDVRRS